MGCVGFVSLRWGTCPAELEAELLAVVQGQRPLDALLMDQIRLGIQKDT